MAEAMSDTITTSDIFQYFSTAMHDSHSLILNMIQQFEKKSFWVYDWKKNININTTSGKTHYFFSIIYLRPKKIIKSHTSWYTYRSYLKFMNGTYSCTCAVVY